MSRFDVKIDRHNTSSRKWDGHVLHGVDSEALPLWVADMDFTTVDEVTNGIRERAALGVYGYPMIEEGTTLAVKNWMKRRFDWDIKESWIVHTSGVVFALNLAVQVYTKPQDAIIINPPVYPPFARAVTINDRTLINCPLILGDDGYAFDFDLFEQQIIEHHVKIYIFCNPHNPIGKVFTKQEIQQIGDLCLKHNVIVLSDEIHQDFVYPEYQHVPFTKADARFEKNTIVCTAPSKTFNLAGMQFSNIIIADEGLRSRFVEGMEKLGIHIMPTFSSLACKLAYDHGDVYVDELVQYVQGNVDYVGQFLSDHLSMIRLVPPQSLYLLWLDMRGLDMNQTELEQFLTKEAKLWVNQGYTFGQEGSGFVRMNVACHRSTLEEAMSSLAQAVEMRMVKAG